MRRCRAARAGSFPGFRHCSRRVTRRFLAARRGTLAAFVMLPISLRPHGRRAVIVGGGNVAARKSAGAYRRGIPVFVVAERIGEPVAFISRESGRTLRATCLRNWRSRRRCASRRRDRRCSSSTRASSKRRVGAHASVRCRRAERGDFTMPATARVGTLHDRRGVGGRSTRVFATRRARARGRRSQECAVCGAHRSLANAAFVKDTFSPEERAEILRALAERPIEELARCDTATAICATRGACSR